MRILEDKKISKCPRASWETVVSIFQRERSRKFRMIATAVCQVRRRKTFFFTVKLYPLSQEKSEGGKDPRVIQEELPIFVVPYNNRGLVDWAWRVWVKRVTSSLCKSEYRERKILENFVIEKILIFCLEYIYFWYKNVVICVLMKINIQI